MEVNPRMPQEAENGNPCKPKCQLGRGRPCLLRLDAISSIPLVYCQILQGNEVYRNRATGSGTKLQHYYNNDKSHQGDKGKKGGRTREIHTDSTEQSISKANR